MVVSVRQRLEEICKKVELLQLEIAKLGLDAQKVRLDCRHLRSHTRSIMGKETVTECDECGKEL